MTTTNQTRSTPSASISITAKHFEDHLDATIVQLAQAISVEQEIPIDPNAIEVVRVKLCQKCINLLSEESKEKIGEVLGNLEKRIKDGKESEEERKTLRVFRILGL